MKNKYNRAMEKIVVTSEMEERILNKLRNTPIKGPVINKVFYFNFRRIAMVACLIILVIGGVFISNMTNKPSPPIQLTNPYVEYNSLDEISKMISYKVVVPSILPFEVLQEQYFLVDEKIVEVTFIGNNNTIHYRTSEGLEDISGDYTDYPKIKEIIINDYKITLKGYSDRYTLAIFSDDDYSYSLQLQNPITENTIIDMLKSIK